MPNEPDDIVIRIKGVVTRFGAVTIHDGINLDVRRGEVLGVVGGSGTGKSVLLRTIIGLTRPTAGQIEVFGHDMLRLSSAEQHQLEQRWGVLFQDGALFSSLTVAQNIEVPLREHFPMPEPLMDEIAAYKIAMSGLPVDAGAKFPSELSGGMRKRAGLARALVLEPRILLADEPSSGLDRITASEIDELLLSQKAEHKTALIVVTHDVHGARRVADRIAVLDQGRLIADGTVAEVEHSENEVARNLIGVIANEN